MNTSIRILPRLRKLRGYENFKCTGSDRGAGGRWENEFEGATGILAGAAAGYSFAGQNPNSPLGGLRVELEYFYRQSNYDQTADIPFGVGTQGDKLRDEISASHGSDRQHHFAQPVREPVLRLRQHQPVYAYMSGLAVASGLPTWSMEASG